VTQIDTAICMSALSLLTYDSIAEMWLRAVQTEAQLEELKRESVKPKDTSLSTWAKKIKAKLTNDQQNDRMNYPEWWHGCIDIVDEALEEAEKLEAE